MGADKMKLDMCRNDFKNAILELNRLEALRLFDEVVSSQAPFDFIDDVMVPVLEDIGEGWESGETALSQVYMSGKICEAIIETRISIPEKSSINNPPMAIVTFDDYHSLGKKIVYSLLKAYGYKIIDYGHGMNNETL